MRINDIIMKLFKLLFLLTLHVCLIHCSCKKEESSPLPFLEVAETDLTVNFPAEAIDKEISIQTNVDDWSVACDQDWCQVSTTNEGQKYIVVKVHENETFDVREASIMIKAANLSETIKVAQLGTKPAILLATKKQTIGFKAQTISVDVTTNVNLEIIFSENWIQHHEGTKSTKVDLVDLIYDFDVDQLQEDVTVRSAKIFFKQKGGDLTDSVIIKQALTLSDDYNPESADVFEKDRKITIQSVSLTPSDKYQGGEEAAKTIDGDLGTLYHSPWAGMQDKPAITLEYTLDPADATIANYVVLHPRTSETNGIIKSATIWINTEEDPTYVQVGTIEAPLSNNPLVARFTTPVVNPRHIKVVITDAYSGDAGKYYVSLAEFECYESRTMNAIEDDLVYFTDNTCSELRSGTTMNDIANIQNPFLQNIAAYLMAGKYSTEYRVQEYEPYREVSDLAKELKTSSYCQFENPTGMYFNKGEDLVVFVGPTNGETVGLRVTDFGQSGDDYSYPLDEGINVLTMAGNGNGYVNYYTSNYQTADNIKIHIASGHVNGFFDVSRHTEEDGKQLLDNAVGGIMDIVGDRTQLAYSVNSLKNHCYGRMKDLIEVYDSIIGSEQTMMGLRKYHRLPKNHMFGRVIWNGFMHADGWGAAFHDDTMGDVANPTNVRNNNWGIAHEFGHVNQVRPGMKWVGTSECTNNIYSAWAQYCYSPSHLRLEHENVGGAIGGRFNAFLNNGLILGQEWGIQAGPDRAYGADNEGKWGGDHFVKLVPLWQLHLYYHIAGEGNSWYKPYFWADIFEKVRNTDESSLTDGELQINFVKNACDAVQQDLSDFFIKIGMLKEIDKLLDDYGTARKTITQTMIDEAISYAKQYPKPETDVIYYISGNSIDAFKNKQTVSGQFNTGVTGTTTKQVSHNDWKNVVVFETYEGDKLTKITMVGTGSSGNTFTKVPYPSGSTRIEAVGYDGTRNLVFGSR